MKPSYVLLLSPDTHAPPVLEALTGLPLEALKLGCSPLPAEVTCCT